jgi:hypothetical protein
MAEHLLDVGTAPLPARSAALTTGDCSTHTPKGIRARPTLQGSFFARMCALRWSPFRPRDAGRCLGACPEPFDSGLHGPGRTGRPRGVLLRTYRPAAYRY